MSLELYDQLKRAGIPDEPAHGLAFLLVTKADLAPLATKADLSELRAEMHKEFATQTRAMITLMIALTGIYAGIVLFALRVMG